MIPMAARRANNLFIASPRLSGGFQYRNLYGILEEFGD